MIYILPGYILKILFGSLILNLLTLWSENQSKLWLLRNC